ncbi:MAG: hypothetical protein RL160_571 [Bacteroidota bacterium]|jgi:hypothetical protein
MKPLTHTEWNTRFKSLLSALGAAALRLMQGSNMAAMTSQPMWLS